MNEFNKQRMKKKMKGLVVEMNIIYKEGSCVSEL